MNEVLRNPRENNNPDLILQSVMRSVILASGMQDLAEFARSPDSHGLYGRMKEQAHTKVQAELALIRHLPADVTDPVTQLNTGGLQGVYFRSYPMQSMSRPRANLTTLKRMAMKKPVEKERMQYMASKFGALRHFVWKLPIVTN